MDRILLFVIGIPVALLFVEVNAFLVFIFIRINKNLKKKYPPVHERS